MLKGIAVKVSRMECCFTKVTEMEIMMAERTMKVFKAGDVSFLLVHTDAIPMEYAT